MPIGDLPQAGRARASAQIWPVHCREKDSQGICFVGKVGIKDFLQQFVADLPGPGNIIDSKGKIVGQHDGALFYTIGQRQGLGVGGGLPYYVVGKDMPKNEVYVTSDLQDPRLWHNQITLASPHWINQPPQQANSTLCARATAPIYCLLTTCTNALIIPAVDS